MFEYLNTLNDAQRAAVENIHGPTLVIAGAGSGKTRVLTYRIAHLLNNQIEAGNVLALTFTNKAAREMKERIADAVGPEAAKQLWMGTFHSIFARILRAEAETLGYPSNFTIYDTQDAKSLIKSIIKAKNLDDKTYRPTVVMSRISQAKNNLVTPAAYAQHEGILSKDKADQLPLIHQIYKEFADRCKAAGAMDFDDLLLMTNILFRDHKEILEKYQDKFKYILVDEYQDTNFSQYLIIKKLAKSNRNLCVVGDDAQSIYSFRGAKIENILNFRTDYPDYKTFKLEQNYRSTQTIVEAANSVIAKNTNQIEKNTFSQNDLGDRIKVLPALTDTEEGILVAKEMLEIRQQTRCKWEDFSILYRTNAQSRVFEESLRKRNIPYKIYGGLSFYQRKEIKDILAYFRLSINPNDDEAMKRVLNFPTRGIGATTQTKIEQAAIFNNVSMYEIATDPHHCQLAGLNGGAFRKVSNFIELIHEFGSKINMSNAFELAEEIIERTGIMELYNKDKLPENMSRLENIQELLSAMQDFTQNSLEEGQPFMISHYLEEVALLTDQDTDKGEDTNRVTLMTVHSSKGLEFKNVFVVGLEENLFPSGGGGGQLSTAELEEERRLFYVAVTRAELRAWLSYAKQRNKWGKINYCEPSRFIGEIEPEFLQMPLERSSEIFRRRQNEQKERIAENQFSNADEEQRRSIQSSGLRMGHRVKQMKEAAKRDASVFIGDDPRLFKIGMDVKHQRFGIGTIRKLEGEMPELKATVEFDNVGTKKLLLKFAKLQIVNN